jgi:hypothetical protein
MQPWQITALKMETSVLEQLDGFIRAHALYTPIFHTGEPVVFLAYWAEILCGE